MLLGHTLGKLGSIVGQRPIAMFSSSIVLLIFALISLYLRPIELQLAFDEGYTTPDAASLKEIRTQIEFFGNQGKPWYMALFAEPKSATGSTEATKEFNEIEQIYRRIKKLPIRFDTKLNRTISYMDLCGTTCDLNELLFKTFDMSFFGITYPVTSIFGYKSNIGKHFYNVTTDENGKILQTKITMLVFMAFTNQQISRDDLTAFEILVEKELSAHNSQNSTLTNITVHGEAGMANAVSKGMSYSASFILNGFIISALALLIVLVLFNQLFGRTDYYRTGLLWLSSLLVPISSIIMSFAIYNLLGYKVTVLTFLAPLLAVAYAYDTVIMLSYTWFNDAALRRNSARDHLLEVFATCMPSITIVSSSAGGLLLGGMFLIPNYAALSVLLGLVLITTQFFTIFQFAPTLLWFAPVHKFIALPQNHPSRKERKCNCKRAMECLCETVSSSKIVQVVGICLIVVIAMILVLQGFKQVRGNLDYRQLLLPDSPNNKGVHYMSDIVWPQWLTVMFFVQNPPDFSNQTQYSRYKAMISEINAIEGKLPEYTDMSWISDFCRHTSTDVSDDALNMTLFKSFIEDDIYKAWKDGTKFTYDENGKAIIDRMLHIVGFNGTQSLSEKAVLFQKCRNIVNKYPEFTVYPFDTEIGLADVILQLTDVIIILPLLAFALLFIFSIFILGNLTVAIVNMIAFVLTYCGAVAIPSFFGLAINPVTASFLLICAVLAPKFSTHFSYFYQQAKRINSKANKKDRLHETLRKSLVPVSASLVCGALILAPLLFCQVSIFQEVGVISVALTGIGFLFSFVVLQLCLNLLPEVLTGTHFFFSPAVSK